MEDIEAGKLTGELLYRVRYLDGDLEHFSATMVKEMLDVSTMATQADDNAVTPISANVIDNLPELEGIRGCMRFIPGIAQDPLVHAPSRYLLSPSPTPCEGPREDAGIARVRAGIDCSAC